MKYKINKEKADNILDELNEVERLLDERISDLHEVKGGMQARHAYVLYRNKLLYARCDLRDSLKPANKNPKDYGKWNIVDSDGDVVETLRIAKHAYQLAEAINLYPYSIKHNYYVCVEESKL
jgi:hypothetical protein